MLMGFGHRVYKNYDPRARIIKRTAEEVFEVTGRQPQAGNRHRAERHRAHLTSIFVKRKLYPNVDFYSGIIYQAMGFKPDIFTVLFAIAAHDRLAGPVAGADDRPGAEDRASAPDLPGQRAA